MTMRPRQPDATARCAGGFTLIESVVSLAVLSIIIVAVGSAMVIASRAIPGQNNPGDSILSASHKLDQLTSELCCAITFTQPATNVMEFTIPDRAGDGDTQPETVRYAWSGTPGDPITRQYNGGNVAVFLENVNYFHLDHDTRTVTTEGQTEVEGSETLLVSHYDTGGTAGEELVSGYNWPGQYFRPELSAQAVGWRITRVRIKARRADMGDSFTVVQLRTADGGSLPTSTILGQVLMADADLAYEPTWQEFVFPATDKLSPQTGACLLLAAGGIWGKRAYISVEHDGSDTPDAHYLKSCDQGSSWTANTGADMVFEVYGVVALTDGSTQYYLRGLGVTIQVGNDPATRVRTTVRMLNQPEVAAGVVGI